MLRFDPCDHFDFGCIPEALALAKPGADGKLPVCDPDHELPADILNHDFLKNEPRPGSSCDGARFSTVCAWRIGDPGEAAMKLDRLLQTQGFGSRRECRARVLAGRVLVDGVAADDPDLEVDAANCRFSVDGVEWRYRERVYLALNKPSGYECSHRPQFHPSVFSLLPPSLLARGVQAVGRLDEDTTGLLLLSDDGQFIHAYSSGKRRVPKVYEVSAKHPVSDEQVAALLAGVQLNDEPEPIAAADCVRLDEKRIRLTVTEGKYHLVKRMVAAAGNRVEALHRVAVGHYVLPQTLAPGQWQWIEPAAPAPA